MADLTVPKTSTVNNPLTPDTALSVEGSPARPSPVVDTGSAVDGYLAHSAQGAQANLAIAFGANPDYEAELSRLSKQTGVPVDSARKFPEQVKQQAAISAIDFQRMVAQFPSTAAFYQNQQNANVAHDDINGLQNVEAAVSGSGAPYAFDGSGTYGALPFRRRLANMISDVSPMLGAVVAGDPMPTSSDPNRQRLAENLSSSWLDQLTQAAGSAGSLGLIPAAPINPDDTGGQIAGGIGGLAGFFAGPLSIGRAAVSGVSKLVPLAVEGTEAGWKALTKTALSSAIELGTASAAGSAGQALNQSTASDAAQVALKSGATGAAMGGSMGAFSRLLPDNTVMQAVLRVAGANVLNDAITGARPWDERPLGQKIVDYGVNSLFSLPGAGRTTGSWLHDAARAEVAAGDGAALQQMSDAASQSKLRDRDPDAFHDFVAQANENGPIQHVYADANELANALNQSGMTDAEFARAMPDVAAQMQLARQTDGMVQISVPDFATHIAGKVSEDFVQNLRTDPEGMTLREANEFRQSSADEFAKRAESIFNEDELRTDHELSTQDVHDNVLANLNEVNRFPADVNKVYARMISSFYGTTAERLGMTPAEMFSRYPLRVAAEDVTGANALSQGLPSEVNVGPSAIRTTPHPDKTFYHETSPQSAASIIADDMTNFAHGARTSNMFVTDDPSLAIGQSGSGVRIEFDGGNVSATLHQKPGTGVIGGNEFRANAIANYSIRRVTVEPGYELPLSRGQKANFLHRFTRADNADGSTTYTRKEQNSLSQSQQPTIIDRASLLAQHQGADGKIDLETAAQATRAEVKSALDAGATVTLHLEGKARKIVSVDSQLRDEKGQGWGIQPVLQHLPGDHDRIEIQYPQTAGPRPAKTGPTGERGKLSFADDITTAPSVITLFKGADLSTLAHESGHHFLNVLDHAARSDAGPVADDFRKVTDWLGTTPDDWRAMSLGEKRQMHEQFARGFEAYLREGNSPSIEMRGVFAKMRAWLVNVYRNIAQLNVSISPEVRGVFDRLLASNSEIQIAEASRSYAPLFKTPEEAGMSPDDYAAYQALGQDATLDAVSQLQHRTLRDMQWLENRKAEALRGVKRDIAEKRDAARTEAAREIDAEPVYQAEQWIRGGREDLADPDATTKLSLEALKDMYGDEANAPWRYLTTGERGLAAVNGVHPDLVAEKFGFSSGDELVRALLAAGKREDAIESLTDRKMLEQHGDISDPGAMDRAADLAIHNQARSRFIATELKALTSAVGSPRDLVRAANEVAARTIAAKRVRDLSPAMFTAAETRAGKQAESLRIKGDIAGAAKAKRDQLLNHALAKAAMEAQADIDADLRYLRKFDSPKKNGDLDPEYRKQIEQLLDQYDLRRSTTFTDIAKRKSLAEFVKAQEDATGVTPDIPDYLLADSTKTSYKDMTVEGWNGLIDSVKSIEHLGKLKHELLTTAAKRDFDDFMTQAVGTITANGGEERAITLERNQLGDDAKAKFSQFMANHRTLGSLLQQMDGHDGGFLWDQIVRPMNDRGVQEATMRADATKALREIIKPIANEKLREKVFIPEIKNSLSREGILSIALNWGNETNQRRVMQGDKWNAGQVSAILKHLSSEDWRTVQKIWDHIDTYWPQIAAKYERVFGVTPQKVEAQPFLTPTGERLRGGYYPIKYDSNRAARAESQQEAATLKQMLGGAYTKATTRRGFTESRLDEVKMPMRKDLGVITEHIDEVIHDLAWHEWLIDANKIFGDQRFEDAVRGHYGVETLRTMKATLKTIAGGDLGARQTMSAAMAFLRNGVGVSRLGYNVATMLKQFAGVGPTSALIGPSYVARGTMEYMGSLIRRAAVTKQVYDRSDFMKIRGQNIDRELSAIRDQINAGKHPIIEAVGKVIPAAHALKPASEAIARSFLGVIEATQKQVDMVSWLGAFRKGQDGGMDDAKAVAYADQIVRDSQGSGIVSDRPEIMAQDKLRLWTMFYAAQNAQFNVLAKANGQGGKAKLAYALALTAVLPSLFNVGVGELKGHQNDSDDWVAKLAADFGWELAGNTLGNVVGLREIPSLLQYGYSGPTVLAPLGDAAKFAKQAAQGEVDESFLRSANMLGGDIFHYPAGMLDRLGRGYMAWQNDQATPAALLFGPPAR